MQSSALQAAIDEIELGADIEAVALPLRHGADCNVWDAQHGSTPLLIALFCGHHKLRSLCPMGIGPPGSPSSSGATLCAYRKASRGQTPGPPIQLPMLPPHHIPSHHHECVGHECVGRSLRSLKTTLRIKLHTARLRPRRPEMRSCGDEQDGTNGQHGDALWETGSVDRPIMTSR